MPEAAGRAAAVVGAYIRERGDDQILAHPLAAQAVARRWLADIRESVRERLAAQRLRLHPRKAEIVPVAGGLDVFGYRVFPWRCRLRNENGHRFARRLRGYARGYAEGRLDWEDIKPSVQSWVGHASHADTLGLRRTLFEATVFVRGSGS